MFRNASFLALSLILTMIGAGCTATRASAEDMPATAPDIQGAPGAQPGPELQNTAPVAGDESQLLPPEATPRLQQQPVAPPTLPNRPPLSNESSPTLPTPYGFQSQQTAKPTLSWRARLQRLSASSSPPVVRTVPGSLPLFFPTLVKACSDAGFETRGSSLASGELWVRSNDAAPVRCSLYFALTENPVGQVVIKASTDRNNATELKVLNAVLSACRGLEADGDDKN